MSDDNKNIEKEEKKGFSKQELLEKLAPLKDSLEGVKDKLLPLLSKVGIVKSKENSVPKAPSIKSDKLDLDEGLQGGIGGIKALDVKLFLYDILDFFSGLVKIDKKKLRLGAIIIALIAFFILDIMWIVTPPKKEVLVDEFKPDYTMEEVAGAMEKYKLDLLHNPKDYNAFIELGKIYRVLDEKEKAKVAFFQAVEYSPEKDYTALFELAGLYICDELPEFTMEVLNTIKDEDLNDKVLYKKARYLAKVASLYYLKDHYHKSYEAYNKALSSLKKVGQKDYYDKINAEKKLLLIDLADYVYYEENNVNQALAYLKESQKIEENPWAFARMGYLYFEQPKMAAEYFERAFNYNPASINHEVFINVLFSAIEMAKKAKQTSDKDYYKYVLEKVRADRHKSTVYKNLRLTNVEAYVEKLDDSELYVPVVYLQVSNASEVVPRDYIKVRAVFYKDNNQIVGHRDEVVVKPIHPLWVSESTNIVKLVSNRPISEKEKDNGVYKVVVYISKHRPDEWRLAGSTFVKKY